MAIKKYDGDRIIFCDKKNEVFLTIDPVMDDNACCATYVLDGKLLSDVSHDLEDDMESLRIAEYGIILDFKKVTYITKSILSVLVNLQVKITKEESGSLLLRNVPDEIYQIMERSAVTEVLNIED